MRAGPAGGQCDLALLALRMACSDTLSGQSRELLAWPMFPQNEHVVLESFGRPAGLQLLPPPLGQFARFGFIYKRITCYALDFSVVEEMLEQPELFPQVQLHVTGCPVS